MKEGHENNSKRGGKEITEKQSQMDQAVNKAKQENKMILKSANRKHDETDRKNVDINTRATNGPGVSLTNIP
jgi:hypothetical protein